MAGGSFSEQLFNRRRELNYSTQQVASQLNIREEILVAFEEGDFDSLPKGGYAQGMLSSYARFLGIDDREIVRQYSDELRERRRAGSGRGRGDARKRPASGRGGSRRGAAPDDGRIRVVNGYGDDVASERRSRPYGGSSLGTAGGRQATRQRQAGREYVDAGYDPYGETRAAAGRARSEYDRGRDSITTRRVVPGEYRDDLTLSDDISPYESASTEEGRRSSRHIASSSRPNVQRRPSDRQMRQVRDRGRASGASPATQIGIVVIALGVVLTLIIAFTVSSCGSSQDKDDGTVAVSTTSSSSSDTTADDPVAQADAEARAAIDAGEGDFSADDDDVETTTSVSVEVEDGAVTWLEILCDGTSEVAETITGPWSGTYVVTDSIVVRAGDTSVVTVRHNGEEVSFESKSSGVGSITIQGTSSSDASADASEGTSSSDAATTSNTTEPTTSTDTTAVTDTSNGNMGSRYTTQQTEE